MDRRGFVFALAIGLRLLVKPLAAEPQARKTPRIGFLSAGSKPSNYLPEFREGLKEFGFVDGQNVAMEFRYTRGDTTKLAELAAELAGLGVDVTVAVGPAALRAARSASASMAIVAIDVESDPVAARYVASLGRPGGNITGTFLDQAEISAKWLQLLKETIPALSRIGVLRDVTTPADQWRAIQMGAKALAIELEPLEVREQRDLDGAFATASRSHAQAVVILSSPLISNSGEHLARLAQTRRLPTISMFRENAAAGCLIAYGPSLADGWHRLGVFAGRILKGSRPGDIPIERPTRFDFVVNLRTAKALGLTIPPSLLLRADQVIEQ